MVEIIPRPIEQTAQWQKVLLYLLIFFVIIFIVSYFLLANLEERSSIYNQELEIKITQGRTAQRISLEEESFEQKKKIETIYPFLEAHTLSSKFFEFLESKTHPRIFFSRLNLDTEKARAILTGATDSFSTLDQQLLVFNQDSLVEDLLLTTANLNKQGGVDFNLEIFLNKNFFQY
jgi:hypothetical protein